MLFLDRHIPLIRQGDKTVTRRDWSDDYHGPNPGSVVPATTELFVSLVECDCFIRIETRYAERLGDVDDDDARAEGYESVAEFREAWREINGTWDADTEVEVLPFTYHGESKHSA